MLQWIYSAKDQKRRADMEKIKKNFGFGFMRLPMKDSEIDTEE